MKHTIVLAAALAAIAWYHALTIEPRPTFNGASFSCPASYDVYASEDEALAGQDYVHCVKQVPGQN
jgi:hypothetical protein